MDSRSIRPGISPPPPERPPHRRGFQLEDRTHGREVERRGHPGEPPLVSPPLELAAMTERLRRPGGALDRVLEERRAEGLPRRPASRLLETRSEERRGGKGVRARRGPDD